MSVVYNARKNPMYGNEHGLPGLPKTTYLTVGGRRVQPQAPKTRTAPPPPPPPPPIKTTRPIPLPTPRPIIMPSGPDPTLSRRIDALDLRINSAEQSNRTLLDELMRLQQDIKGSVRNNEMKIQEGREGLNRLDTNHRQTQSKTQELDDRLRRCEEGVRNNQASIQQLSSHVKNIEGMVSSLHQEQLDRKGDTENKHSAYRNEVTRLNNETEQLNRLLTKMREEAKDSGRRIDGMNGEIGSLQSSVNMHARLLAENTNQPAPKTPAGVDKNIFDNDRINTESKLRQMNKTVNDVQNRLNSEAENRQKIEHDFNNKLNSLLTDNSDVRSKYDQKQKEYDEKMKGMQMGFSDMDKKQIKMEMSNIAQTLNNKIAANDEKIREDTIDKLTVIEKTLKDDNTKRAVKEKIFEDKIEKGMKEIKDKGETDSQMLKTELDKQVKDNKEKLTSLNKRMGDAEKAIKDQKLEHERLIEAEITERLNSDKILDAKIDDLEDDIQLGFKTLQEEIGHQKKNDKKPSKDSKSKAPPPPSVDLDEIEELQKKNAEGIRAHVASEVKKLDKRVSSLETDTKQRDANVANLLAASKNDDKQAANLLGDNMQQQIDAVVFKHNKLKKKVDDLEKDVTAAPKHAVAGKTETDEALALMRKDIDKEQKERKSDVKNLKDNINRIVGSENQAEVPSLAQLNMDVDQTQTGLKKCAESIHVVKTMLSDKIKDERKIREKQCSILETDVERLDTKIKELRERIKNNSNNDTLQDLDDFM